MPRRSVGPWKRSGRGWYVTIGKEQIKLGPPEMGRKDAVTRWHEELAKPRGQEVVATPANEITADEVADRYLVWVGRNRSDSTHALAKRYLLPWVQSLDKETLAERVRPFDASEWIDLRHEKPGARRMAYRVVKAAWRWADQSGLIDRNPLRGLKTPAGSRRETVLTAEEWRLVTRAASVSMRRLLRIARWTGMRAQEVVRVEARHLDKDAKAIRFPAAEAKGKRRPRVVYVVDKAWRILRAAAKRHPQGAVLRNEDKTPWTKSSVVANIRRLRGRLERAKTPVPGLCLTALRHTYATDAIIAGVDVVTLAELMGHKDATMISEIYAKVGQRSDHMRKAADKALGD